MVRTFDLIRDFHQVVGAHLEFRAATYKRYFDVRDSDVAEGIRRWIPIRIELGELPRDLVVTASKKSCQSEAGRRRDGMQSF